MGKRGREVPLCSSNEDAFHFSLRNHQKGQCWWRWWRWCWSSGSLYLAIYIPETLTAQPTIVASFSTLDLYTLCRNSSALLLPSFFPLSVLPFPLLCLLYDHSRGGTTASLALTALTVLTDDLRLATTEPLASSPTGKGHGQTMLDQ